jgi:cytidine deaminase
VGAVLTGGSGRAYPGFNLEFSQLGLTLHAEIAAMVLAVEAGERSVVRLEVDAPPCGHCRQFMLESKPFEVWCPGWRGSSHDLLPAPFGPRQLGRAPDLFGSSHPWPEAAPLLAWAQLACGAAHTPYHRPAVGLRSGAAVAVDDGTVVVGRSLQSVAFNPSVGAMTSAVAQLRSHRIPSSRWTRACLVVESGPLDVAAEAQAILRDVGPVPLTIRTLDGTQLVTT